MIRFRPEDSVGGAPAEDAPVVDDVAPAEEPTTTPQATPAGWAGPTQEEWQAQQAAIARMAAYFEDDDEETGPPEVDPSEIGQYINTEMERRLKSDPIYQAAINERGERVLNDLHDRYEKEFKKPFDRALAKRAGESFAIEGVPAQEAVKRGVEYAIEVREQERLAGVEEYKASLKRGPHDGEPGSGGGGDRPAQAFKSYDEVTEFYANQTEV